MYTERKFVYICGMFNNQKPNIMNKVFAMVQTKSNFRNLNGQKLEVAEMHGTRVSCKVEIDGQMMIVDFNLNEIVGMFSHDTQSEAKPEPMETPNPLDAHKLKIGSIVEMMYTTYANSIKPEWTIVEKHMSNGFNGEVEMATYKANCRVCNVTPKFFQVIIPHLNSMSVRYSKDVFTTTKNSYGNHGDFRPSIVQI